MRALAILGSRDTEGRTAQAAEALLAGVRQAGGETQMIWLTRQKVERCRQCDENGWGLCRREGRCVIDDDLAAIVDAMREADALVFATPVYYGDLSESTRAFTDRLRRICTQPAGKERVEGKPTVCICVAGGGGGGAPSCCVTLERVLRIAGCDVVDVVPVRRQNLALKCELLSLTGRWLADLPTSQSE